MIQVTPHMRILVAVEPTDFRRGIDGLARVCREMLHRDPFSGWVFVFRNRRCKAIKILVYDGQGFWLCQKRLSKGCFRWWPDATGTLEAHQLPVLLSGGDPAAAKGAPAWRPLNPRE
jgi:transposase